MLGAIVHGFILAFGLILPLGVQNVFVLNQGATQPRFNRALPAIITASICDTILISLAVLGVSAIIFGFYLIKVGLLIVGVLFLVYMGYVTWRSIPSKQISEDKALSTKNQVAFAASVSLLNPHAIMDTIGVIGTTSIFYTGVDKIAFTLASIVTSWVWFFALALVGSQIRSLKSSKKLILILNKVSAIIMWGTAIYLLFVFSGYKF